VVAAGKRTELDKAQESLKKFVNKEKKTKPTKKHLDLQSIGRYNYQNGYRW